VEHERSRKTQEGIDRNVHFLLGYQPVKMISVRWEGGQKRDDRGRVLASVTFRVLLHFSPPRRRLNRPGAAMTRRMFSVLFPYRVHPGNQDEGLGFRPA